jgi:hypothetical protein
MENFWASKNKAPRYFWHEPCVYLSARHLSAKGRSQLQLSPVRLFVAAIAVAFAFAGCAATKIVTEWRNPDYASPRFKKILVIGRLKISWSGPVRRRPLRPATSEKR